MTSITHTSNTTLRTSQNLAVDNSKDKQPSQSTGETTSTAQNITISRPISLPHVQQREALQKKGVIDEHAIITSNTYEKLGIIPHVSDRSHEEELLAISIPLIHRNGEEIICLTGELLSEKFFEHLSVKPFWKGKNVPYVCDTKDLFSKGVTRCGAETYTVTSSSSKEKNERITILCFIEGELDQKKRGEIIEDCAQFLFKIQKTNFSQKELMTHGMRVPQTSDENLLVVEFGNIAKIGPSFQLIFGTPKRLGLDVKDALFLAFNSPEAIQPVSVEGISTWQAIFDCELHITHIPDLDAIDTNGLIKILMGLTLQDTYMPWDKSSSELDMVVNKLFGDSSTLENVCFDVIRTLSNQERLPLTFLISHYLKSDVRDQLWELILKDYSSKTPFFQCIQELVISKKIPIETVNALLHHAALIRLQEPSDQLESSTGIQLFREKETDAWKVVYRIGDYSLKLPINFQEAHAQLLKASPDQLQQLKLLWELIVPANYNRAMGVSPFLEAANLFPALPQNMEAAAIQLLEQADPFMQFLGFRIGIASLNLKNSVILKTALLSKIPFLLDNCDQKASIFNEAGVLFDLPNKTIPENASVKELQWMWIESLCFYKIDLGYALKAWQKLLPHLLQDEVQKYFLHLHSFFIPVGGSAFLISFFSYLTPATCTQAIRTLIDTQRLDKQSLAEMIEKHLLPQNNQELLETCLTQLSALSGFLEVVQVLSQANSFQKEFISTQCRQTFEEAFRVNGKETALSIWLHSSFQPMLQEADKKVCFELLLATNDKLVLSVLEKSSDDSDKLELFKYLCSQNKHTAVLNTLSNSAFIQPSSPHYFAYQQEAIVHFDAFCKSSQADPLWQMDSILKLMATDALKTACREKPRLIHIMQFFLNLKQPSGERPSKALGSYESLARNLQVIITEEVAKQNSLSLTSAWVELVKRETAALEIGPEDQLKVYTHLQKNNRLEILFDLLKLAKYPHHLVDRTVFPIYLWAFKEMLTQQPTSWHRVQTAMVALSRKNKALREEPHVQDWLSLYLTILPNLDKPHNWLVAIQSIIDLAPVTEQPQVVSILQTSLSTCPFESAYLLFKKNHKKLHHPAQICLEMLKKKYADPKDLIPCLDFLKTEAAVLASFYQNELMPFIDEKVQLLLKVDTISLEMPLKIMELYGIKHINLWFSLLDRLRQSSFKELQQRACQEWKKHAPTQPPGHIRESCWLFAIECGIRSESDTFLANALDNTWVKSTFPSLEQQLKFYAFLLAMVPKFPRSKALDWNLFRQLRSSCENTKKIKQVLPVKVFFLSLYDLLIHNFQVEDVASAATLLHEMCTQSLTANQPFLSLLIPALLNLVEKHEENLSEKCKETIIKSITLIGQSNEVELKKIVRNKLLQANTHFSLKMAVYWIHGESKETKAVDSQEVYPVFKRYCGYQNKDTLAITQTFLNDSEFVKCMSPELYQELRMHQMLCTFSLYLTSNNYVEIKEVLDLFITHYQVVKSHPSFIQCDTKAYYYFFLFLILSQDYEEFQLLIDKFIAQLPTSESTIHPIAQQTVTGRSTKEEHAQPQEAGSNSNFFNMFFSCIELLKPIIEQGTLPSAIIITRLQQFVQFCVTFSPFNTHLSLHKAYMILRLAYSRSVFANFEPLFLKCYLILNRLGNGHIDHLNLPAGDITSRSLPEKEVEIDALLHAVWKEEEDQINFPVLFSTCESYLKQLIQTNLMSHEKLAEHLYQFGLFCIKHTPQAFKFTKTPIEEALKYTDRAYALTLFAKGKAIFEKQESIFLKCYLILGKIVLTNVRVDLGYKIYSLKRNKFNIDIYGLPTEAKELKAVLCAIHDINETNVDLIFEPAISDLISLNCLHGRWKGLFLTFQFFFLFSEDFAKFTKHLLKILLFFRSNPELMLDVVSNETENQQAKTFLYEFLHTLKKSGLYNEGHRAQAEFIIEKLFKILSKISLTTPEHKKYITNAFIQIMVDSKEWPASLRSELVCTIIRKLARSKTVPKEYIYALLGNAIKLGSIIQKSDDHRKAINIIVKAERKT